MENQDRELMRAVARYLEHVNTLQQQEREPIRTPLGDLISDHLGSDAMQLSVVEETIANHRLVDADIALEIIAAECDGALVGISGGEQRHSMAMAELVANPYLQFAPGPVDYAERATGPDVTRRIVVTGVRLLRHEGKPVALTQRAASPTYGRSTAVLEVMATDPDTVSAFLSRVRSLMLEHSTLRGQVLSFDARDYASEGPGATFLHRPSISSEEVILPEGVLNEVANHVIGIGEQRDFLLSANQHLKRGVLLYGPPGTGKTLTVRHLLTQAADATIVLLTGTSIQFIGAAAEIARTFAPSIVVLEDIDLVAMERHSSPQPLLFEVLEALDGLEGDADVAFVMTTNRVEVLERALAQRPGRVDLAVEIPLPALTERERLFRHYARELAFSDDALDDAAARTEGVTASFAKELIRRAVLLAATQNEQVTDAHLDIALNDLLSARNHLTRSMLGAQPDEQQETEFDEYPAEGFSASRWAT